MTVRRGRFAIALLGAMLLAGCLGGRRSGPQARPKVDYKVVKPAVAFALLQDNESLIIIDLRPAGEYAGPGGHLNGAVNMPLSGLTDQLPNLWRLRRRTFLVYCDGSDCGPRGIRLLRDHGFLYVVLMDGGLPAWKGEGFGVVYGGAPRVP